MKRSLFLLLAIVLLFGSIADCETPVLNITPNCKVVQAGRLAEFSLHMPRTYVKRNPYYVIGAAFDVAPPITPWGIAVPLANDEMLRASLTYANTWIFQNTFGIITKQKTSFAIQTIRHPALFGMKIYLSALAYDGCAFYVAAPSSLRILPHRRPQD